jgi:hypothetical protein
MLSEKGIKRKTAEVGIVSLRGDVHVFIIVVVVVDACGMHQTSHLPLVFVQLFIVVVHSGFGFFGMRRHISIQELAKPSHALTAEHTKDISLLLSELWWGFSTKCREVFVEECLHTGQAQVCKAWAVIDQRTNALDKYCQYPIEEVELYS